MHFLLPQDSNRNSGYENRPLLSEDSGVLINLKPNQSKLSTSKSPKEYNKSCTVITFKFDRPHLIRRREWLGGGSPRA